METSTESSCNSFEPVNEILWDYGVTIQTKRL